MNRLSIFSLALALAFSFAAKMAHAEPARTPGESRAFWVKKAGVYQRAQTTLRFAGDRSYIYVEEDLWNAGAIRPVFLKKLAKYLEVRAPKGAWQPELGIVRLEELLFGPLPKVISPDDRVAIVIADLKNSTLDGYFFPFDQFSESNALPFGHHSNEGNIIYLNGMRRNENYTVSVIAQELQNLLAYHPTASSDLWFLETLGKTAKFATGFYSDQPELNQFASSSSDFPLVSQSYVQQGPQLLFASFLLNAMTDKARGLYLLTALSGNGRGAVEILFRHTTGRPLTFDVIFSQFLDFVFAGESSTIPGSGEPPTLRLPAIQPYATLESYPTSLRGSLMPYSVLAVDLPKALPPSAIIRVQTIRENSPEGSCGQTASVLWKPVHLKRIAIYSVGCEHHSPEDRVQFHLTVLNRPSLLPSYPFKITP